MDEARALLEQAKEALNWAASISGSPSTAVSLRQVIAAIDAYLSTPASAAPTQKRQYFYRVTGCPTKDASDPRCICWHDEGTGPLVDSMATATDWRDAPARAAPALWAKQYDDGTWAACLGDVVVTAPAYPTAEAALAAAGAAPAAPFAKGSWQHAVDDALVDYLKTTQDFATPHAAVRWLLQTNARAALDCAAPAAPKPARLTLTPDGEAVVPGVGVDFAIQCLARADALLQGRASPSVTVDSAAHELRHALKVLRDIVAAAPKPLTEAWICLLCKSGVKGWHGTLDDKVTPCPDGITAAATKGEVGNG